MRFNPLHRTIEELPVSGTSTQVASGTSTPRTGTHHGSGTVTPKTPTRNASGNATPKTPASRSASRPSSVGREKTAYNMLGLEELDQLQGDMLISCLWQEQQKMQFTSCPPERNEGVIIRTQHTNRFMCQPPTLREDQQPLWIIAQELNFRVRSFSSLPPFCGDSLTVCKVLLHHSH